MKSYIAIITLLAGLAAAAPVPCDPRECATDKRQIDSAVVAQLQSTFDRNNPNGTPANGSEDDLNGDGVINVFEEGAQAGKRDGDLVKDDLVKDDLVKDCDPRECATD